MNHLSNLVSRQKKLDYKPKEDVIISFAATPTCVVVCDFLKKMGDACARYLDGENLLLFLNEVGACFHA